ncbi:MAG: hypothetical protein SGPRY_008647 [Prymnesium sp.]
MRITSPHHLTSPPHEAIALLHRASPHLTTSPPLHLTTSPPHLPIQEGWEMTPEDEERVDKAHAHGARRAEALWEKQAQMRSAQLQVHEDVLEFAHSKVTNLSNTLTRPERKISLDQRRRAKHHLEEMFKRARAPPPPDEATIRDAEYTQAYFDKDGVCRKQFRSELASAEARWRAEAEGRADSNNEDEIEYT